LAHPLGKLRALVQTPSWIYGVLPLRRRGEVGGKNERKRGVSKKEEEGGIGRGGKRQTSQ